MHSNLGILIILYIFNMLFNSFEYALFLPLVFIIYWFILRKNIKLQNIFLLVSSYFFYGCWDWRFLFLLMFSTFLDYFTGLKIADSSNQKIRKAWLWLSVGVNLSFLGFFKYYNFFVEQFAELLSLFGLTPHISTLNIILPVGISFYTFHGLSYVFDIYHDKIKPTKNLVNYSLFVSFFPLLVAGPIERATHLLPQIERKRVFDFKKFEDGLRQILWGLFMKIVIADNCAKLADAVFNQSDKYSGSTLVVGAIFFTIQAYGDFAGYSNIALGSARLLGFELLKNFNFPYFSRNIRELWRRWHMSLSYWLRDYLYIPLGGGREGMAKTIRNTAIVFLTCGFWHGANWTFLAFGAIHTLYVMPSILKKRTTKYTEIVAQGKILPTPKEVYQIIKTFCLFAFSLIVFRAESITQAYHYIIDLFTVDLFSMPQVYSGSIILLVIIFFLIEWIGREGNYGIEGIKSKIKSMPLRWMFYYVIAFLVFYYSGHKQAFIYFQF